MDLTERPASNTLILYLQDVWRTDKVTHVYFYYGDIKDDIVTLGDTHDNVTLMHTSKQHAITTQVNW